jgi:S-adenosylmethionine hydrolase
VGKLGGATQAVELADPRYRLADVSASFHGRDIFAPAAAHLANKIALEELGPSLDPATLVRLPIPRPEIGRTELTTHVIYVDTFGNVKLTALAADLHAAIPDLEPGDELSVELGDDNRSVALRWRTTFGDAAPGEPLLYEDSYGRLCLAVNQGDAATTLQLVEDLPARIRRAG